MARYEIIVTGAVQGVGYRPFAAAMAKQYGIRGNVRNEGGIVRILADAPEEAVRSYAKALKENAPAGALVLRVTVRPLAKEDDRNVSSGQVLPPGDVFRILESRGTKKDRPRELDVFTPDIGICPDCLREMQSARDRRFRYPLISCASCGPRWSILKHFPYDRETTSMDIFSMCGACAAEYLSGRRRHAQTISCHSCGPQMLLLEKGTEISGETAFSEAVRILKSGGILALKGVGGYQLLCTPYLPGTVARLRAMKGREEKPFAVMFESLEEVLAHCGADEEEQRLLKSAARPIVLLESAGCKDKRFAFNVSGNSRYLGAFLPSSGVHEMLCKETGPLVVTSANLSGSPIPIDDVKFFSLKFQGGDAPDGVYYHARQILRPLDDSVVFMNCGSVQMIRRSRGYVPMPVFLEESSVKGAYDTGGKTILACGADLKAAFAVRRNGRVIPSQYYGDLSAYEVLQNYARGIDDLEQVFDAREDAVVCDLHPSYFSTAYAKKRAEEEGVPLFYVQHHHAHAASVMAEHGLRSCIGVIMDGTGYGSDGSVWGGEFLYCEGADFKRLGCLSPVNMCGGDAVSRNADLAALFYKLDAGAVRQEDIPEELRPAAAALRAGIGVYQSSSMGRLFDAAAAILDIAHRNGYEGECAAELENAADRGRGCAEATDCAGTLQGDIARMLRYFRNLTDVSADGMRMIRAGQLIQGLLAMRRSGLSTEEAAYYFHLAVAYASAEVVVSLSHITGEKKIALGGGTFTNRILTKALIQMLSGKGLSVYRNEQVPGNDGGIALGQAYLAGILLSRQDGVEI